MIYGMRYDTIRMIRISMIGLCFCTCEKVE